LLFFLGFGVAGFLGFQNVFIGVQGDRVFRDAGFQGFWSFGVKGSWVGLEFRAQRSWDFGA
jgi:hypothetical protein